MVFKNDAQLKAFLMAKCKNALIQAQERVYQIVDTFVKEFYDDYTPEMYQRTYQLYRSLVKSDIIPTGNGYKAEVYFDLDGLKYSKYPWQGGNVPTGEQVFDAAKYGLHGAIGSAGGGYQFFHKFGDNGISIWYDPIRELDTKAIDILVDMLRAEGIPVKKG